MFGGVKHPFGRPRRRCKYNIKIGLREISSEDWGVDRTG
jgi:hypothetical protein